MEILHFKELGDTESVYLVIDNFGMYLMMLTPESNIKAIGKLVMKLLHFKDLGVTESVITNAVVLVLGKCQILIATYLRGYLPSYKVVLKCICDDRPLNITVPIGRNVAGWQIYSCGPQ